MTSYFVMISRIVCFTAVLLLLRLPGFSQDAGSRTEFFPVHRKQVKKMPKPRRLWVFFMAGQSNMAGRGQVEPQDTQSSLRIITLNASKQWIYAKEPLHYYEPNLTGLDCGMSFARTLLADVPKKVTVAIIPCAVGGSSIEQWLEDDTYRGVTLLSNFKEKVALAKQYGTIKGILWHQGESNSKPDRIPNYEEQLQMLIDTFRGITGNPKLPVLIGELGSYFELIEAQQNSDAINAIIHQVGLSDPNVRVITTADLHPKEDKVHFNSAGQREMGRRFAEAFLGIK